MPKNKAFPKTPSAGYESEGWEFESLRARHSPNHDATLLARLLLPQILEQLFAGLAGLGVAVAALELADRRPGGGTQRAVGRVVVEAEIAQQKLDGLDLARTHAGLRLLRIGWRLGRGLGGRCCLGFWQGWQTK